MLRWYPRNQSPSQAARHIPGACSGVYSAKKYFKTVLFVFILSFIVEQSFRLVRNDIVMPSDSLDRSMSSLSADSQSEDDWDLSLTHDTGFLASSLQISAADVAVVSHFSTPRNSIIFPAEETPGRTTRYSSGSVLHSRNGSLDILDGGIKKRTLSDLLQLHSEKGSNGDFNAEEAKRIADVLGQWVGQRHGTFPSY